MQVVLPPPVCLPSEDRGPAPCSAPAEAAAEDVRGGGAGGPEEDWTSLAWPVAEVLEREEVVERDRWAGVDPSWGFLLLSSSLLSSSSGSLLTPELHSSLTLSLSLCRAMSASSSEHSGSVPGQSPVITTYRARPRASCSSRCWAPRCRSRCCRRCCVSGDCCTPA